jgi:hypothetical protein
VEYLTLLLGGPLVITILMCIQMPVEFVLAIAPQSATRKGAGQRIWKVEAQIVSIQFLLTLVDLPAFTANKSSLLENGYGKSKC